MAWVTKLTQEDYSVIRQAGAVIIQDNRNKLAYKLADHVARHFQVTYGFQQPDRLWVYYAISQCLIPHPYDEWV